MSCTVVRDQDQPRLYDAVSDAIRTGDPFAVLDPTWPESYLRVATGQVENAVSCGVVGHGDMVVFSSGSTGQPRGIVRSAGSWLASFASFSDVTGITRQDTVWLPGPLWSSLFLFGALHAGKVGAKVLFRDDDPAGATALHCVPSQLPGLLERAEAGGLPLVRHVVVAGDHCSEVLRGQCVAAGWHLVEYYGAAELSIVAWRDRSGGFGAFPGVELELRDGNLWVRSPFVVRGYLSDHSDGPLQSDPRGWATVGDLARAVGGGGIDVVGRGNAAVTTGGHTVVVEEVERLLRLLPEVEDAAVFGLPHPRLGQVLAAVVVGPAVDATLRAATAAMPGPSRPRRWFHARALPRTSGGKLHRDALPDLVSQLGDTLPELGLPELGDARPDLVSKCSDAPPDLGVQLSSNDGS